MVSVKRVFLSSWLVVMVQAVVSMLLLGCDGMPKCNNEPITSFKDFKGCVRKQCFKGMKVIVSAPGHPHERFQNLVRTALARGDQLDVVFDEAWESDLAQFWNTWEDNVRQSYQTAEACKHDEFDQKLLVLTK